MIVGVKFSRGAHDLRAMHVDIVMVRLVEPNCFFRFMKVGGFDFSDPSDWSYSVLISWIMFGSVEIRLGRGELWGGEKGKERVGGLRALNKKKAGGGGESDEGKTTLKKGRVFRFRCQSLNSAFKWIQGQLMKAGKLLWHWYISLSHTHIFLFLVRHERLGIWISTFGR